MELSLSFKAIGCFLSWVKLMQTRTSRATWQTQLHRSSQPSRMRGWHTFWSSRTREERKVPSVPRFTRDEALGVTVQIKNYLPEPAVDGPLTIGVKAALAGSVLSNLPTSLPQRATEIQAILQGIESLTFQWWLFGQGRQVGCMF